MQRKIKNFKCQKCSACCSQGVWLTLSEAQKIMRRHPGARFHWLKYDDKEYWTNTSYRGKCQFLSHTGCLIYDLRPKYCKEFPLEDGKPRYSMLKQCKAIKLMGGLKNGNL